MKNEERPKILIVDDRPENLVAMKRILKNQEAELITASSGNETLSMTINHRFALILLDVMMPDMDGFETAELLRQNDSTKHIPIIFVTAISKERQHVFKGYEAGAVDYIFKPFTPEILSSKVRIFLELYRQQYRAERALAELRKAEEERIKYEAASRRVEELEKVGVMAGGIAHDFNNLLTVILGNINLATYTLPQDHKALPLLASAEKASLTAHKLTDQLLTFAKGGGPVKGTASLGGVIREAVAYSLHGSNVSCRFDIPDGLWLADVDKGQIGQVVQNLVINSDHALPQGGIVEVCCRNYIHESDDTNLKAGRYIEVAVKDNGSGISAEHLTHIFDPYFTTKERGSHKGSGLGLATAHSIIRWHHGFIRAESVEGGGSVFTFYLPATVAGLPENFEEEGRISFPCGQGNILVMDDDEMVGNMMSLQLKSLGYKTEVVEDGKQALDQYRKAAQKGKTFDVVIMDLTIPGGMGGQEAIAKLLAEYPDAVAIVSSGYSNDEAMVDPGLMGFKGAITKPYNIDQLAEVLRAVLENGEVGK